MWNISAGSLVENGDEFQDGHRREANQGWALLRSGACADSTGGPPRKLPLGNRLTDSADPYRPFCALDPQDLSLLYMMFWLNVRIHLQLQCLSLEGRAISPYNLALALCWHTVCGLLMEIFPKDWGDLHIIIARYMSQHPKLAVKLRPPAPGSHCSKYHPLLQSIYLPLPPFPHSSNLFGLSQYTVLLHIHSFSQPAGIYWAHTRCPASAGHFKGYRTNVNHPDLWVAYGPSGGQGWGRSCSLTCVSISSS